MQNVNRALQNDPLVQLIQAENFIGWVYSMDYEYAHIMTNDLWKSAVLGVPHNCFLVASSFDPSRYAGTHELDKEVILLRVISSCPLPQDADMIRAKIDNQQEQEDVFAIKEFDDITKNQLQFSGLKARVLGTFFVRNGNLVLGSDLESFAVSTVLRSYRPRGIALKTIVNYVDPIRKQASVTDANSMGITGEIAPIRVGTVRYTSTDRLHRNNEKELVPVNIQPYDFLARRTAVLGMTRTGKSNMIKKTVSVVKGISTKSNTNIGQIIFDINGEYANANKQDNGALAEVYPNETVRYRMLDTPGFEVINNNFYFQISEGFAVVRQIINETQKHSQGDVQVFVNASFDQPDKDEDPSTYGRWERRVAAYQALLYKAEYHTLGNVEVKFAVDQKVLKRVQETLSNPNLKNKNPKYGLTLEEAVTWFLAAREANRTSPLLTSKDKEWIDGDTKSILNLLAQKNDSNTYIKGYKILSEARKYHSPKRTQDVGDEIYSYLKQGKIVILDLSVGDPSLRETIGLRIATEIFNKSMNSFVTSGAAPNIVIFVEEAHNLIGKNKDLGTTWPRIAKEGAKYRIALVYATQEVSSVHPNILANTENWFVTHLNNEGEMKELAKFYDFADFASSIVRVQDVGFARVKTLSSPFVIPVQIDKFDPAIESNEPNNLGI